MERERRTTDVRGNHSPFDEVGNIHNDFLDSALSRSPCFDSRISFSQSEEKKEKENEWEFEPYEIAVYIEK